MVVKAHGGRFGYGVLETTLICVILLILGFTTWFIHASTQSTQKTLNATNQVAQATSPKQVAQTQVTTFAECKQAAGSRLLATYPEQCVAMDGKTFTDAGRSASTAPAASKAPADSPMPAAGTCVPTNGSVVTVTLVEGVPNPRCSQVTAEQTLTVVNPGTTDVTVKLGGQSVVVPAGKSGTIAVPFGDYLQSGDHVMQTGLYGSSGPEIYLSAN